MMGKVYNNIVNDKNKTLTWKNANFYYISTIMFVLVLIVTFLFCRPAINALLDNSIYWNMIFLPFRHSGWVHLIGNILCFFVVSLFLERRFGSLKFFLIILMSILISPLANFALLGLYGQGESLVNFFLFGIFFVEVLFNFKECFLTKYQNIFTIVTIILIFLLMSFTIDIQFSPFVTLLTVNHGSAFVEGVIIGLFSRFIVSKS